MAAQVQSLKETMEQHQAYSLLMRALAKSTHGYAKCRCSIQPTLTPANPKIPIYNNSNLTANGHQCVPSEDHPRAAAGAGANAVAALEHGPVEEPGAVHLHGVWVQGGVKGEGHSACEPPATLACAAAHPQAP